MLEKIKTFLKNPIVQKIEMGMIIVASLGLIIAGFSIDEVQKYPTIAVGIFGSISGFLGITNGAK